MKRLILVLAMVGTNTFAQNTVVVVPPVDPYAQAIIQTEAQLALTRSQNPIVSVVIWTKCNHITSIYTKYANGQDYSVTYKGDEMPVDPVKMMKLIATGKVSVIDADFGIPHCEH